MKMLYAIVLAGGTYTAAPTVPKGSLLNVPDVAKSKGYNYRDSGSGRYMKKRAAQRKPANTVEKERRQR